jgi:hypothetical protein
MQLPEHDRRGWEAFLARWAAASPREKLTILVGKLALLLAFLGVIVVGRWLVTGLGQ